MSVTAELTSSLSRISWTEIVSLRTVAIFCVVGLALCLMFASYGVELSAGLF
jgi:hypothetical protein